MGSPLLATIAPKEKDIGAFSVRRALPDWNMRAVGPFVFFDHFGPVHLAGDEAMDVRPHPHINIATVTYLFDGQILHRDSLGNEKIIHPGAINLMVAGRGIAHSERTPEAVRRWRSLAWFAVVARLARRPRRNRSSLLSLSGPRHSGGTV